MNWQKRSLPKMVTVGEDGLQGEESPNFHTVLTAIILCDDSGGMEARLNSLKVFIIGSFTDNLTYLILSASGDCCLVAALTPAA